MQPSNYLFLSLQCQLVIGATHEDHISHLRHRGYRYLQYLAHQGITLPLQKVGIQALQCRAIGPLWIVELHLHQVKLLYDYHDHKHA